MQNYCFELFQSIEREIQGEESLIGYFSGEHSDFVRFNQNRIRQAGHVRQLYLRLTIIDAGRQAQVSLCLSGDQALDRLTAGEQLHRLREQLSHLPQDPFLNFATGALQSEKILSGNLPRSEDAVRHIHAFAHDLDLVGLWSAGPIFRGLASSFGARHWHEVESFHFDWSVYTHGDKAVKSKLAGNHWSVRALEQKIDQCRTACVVLQRPAIDVKPGRYRCFLSPTALKELLDMMAWGGFGVKSHRSANSALLKMSEENLALNSVFSLAEDFRHGTTPGFTPEGFLKPERVDLIAQGKLRELLVSPRSAKEYGLPVNCDSERPSALNLAPGAIPQEDILKHLHDGIYINNLWYCNFSDYSACRVTGMTRFACFRVENGAISAPIGVMRFDDSLFDVFGRKLAGLTQSQETLFDDSTYGGRSTASYRIPGMLVNEFNLSF